MGLREALEQILPVLDQLHDLESYSFTVDLSDEIALAREALAQQPAESAKQHDGIQIGGRPLLLEAHEAQHLVDSLWAIGVRPLNVDQQELSAHETIIANYAAFNRVIHMPRSEWQTESLPESKCDFCGLEVSYCWCASKPQQPAATNHMVQTGIVHICPLKDGECGDFTAHWCDECPKRKHIQQPAAVVELTDAEIVNAMLGSNSWPNADRTCFRTIHAVRAVIAAHIAKQGGAA